MRLLRGRVALTALAAFGLALAVANMVLFESNRALQLDVGARAQYIQQTVQLETLNREIVGAIAQLAVRNKDEALRSVLTQHGITVTASAGSGSAPAAAPGPAPVASAVRR